MSYTDSMPLKRPFIIIVCRPSVGAYTIESIQFDNLSTPCDYYQSHKKITWFAVHLIRLSPSLIALNCLLSGNYVQVELAETDLKNADCSAFCKNALQA